MSQPEPPVVGATFTLELHTPETHAYPAVQAAKEVAASRERGCEIVRGATNDPVEFRDGPLVQVVVPGRQFSNLGLELLDRLGTHRDTPGRDGKAQEGKAFAELGLLRFLGTQGEVEGVQMQLHHVGCLLDLTLGLAQDHEVIGITHEAAAVLVELPVEAVESDVGQQGRNDSSLRRAERRRSKQALLHHSGLERSFDQAENVAIGDLGSHTSHDDLVGDVVKEPLDVGIEYVDVPLPMELQHSLHGLMAVAARPKTEGIVVKHSLEERAEELPKHLLSNPVADGRDPQRACLAWTLGDVHAPQGKGLKSPFLEVVHQGQQILLQVCLEHGDADLIDPCRAPVTFDVPKSAVHEVAGDPPRQRVGFDLGQLGSFPVEPLETEPPGSASLSARGECFLAAAALPERGSSGPWRAQRCRLTTLMVRRLRLPSHTDGPFTGQCGQPLCPGEPTTHPDGPQRPTVSGAAERSQRTPKCFHRLGSLAPRRGRNVAPPELSLPGPFVAAHYWTTLAAYLSARRVRARISARARPRTGRIRSVGVGPIAPFMTEPTTP